MRHTCELKGWKTRKDRLEEDSQRGEKQQREIMRSLIQFWSVFERKRKTVTYKQSGVNEGWWEQGLDLQKFIYISLGFSFVYTTLILYSSHYSFPSKLNWYIRWQVESAVHIDATKDRNVSLSFRPSPQLIRRALYVWWGTQQRLDLLSDSFTIR